MQIDGYSLDAQKTKMKAFCDYNEYEIAGEYEDAGKSGKLIEGRIAFNQMMDDIKSGKDEVSYVLVFSFQIWKKRSGCISSLHENEDFGDADGKWYLYDIVTIKKRVGRLSHRPYGSKLRFLLLMLLT